MRKVDLFLDSGAFSAWSKGVVISVEEYIAFIKKYAPYLSMYSVLDVIGDPEKTLENQRIMEKAGLTPVPCFHFGEPFKYLKNYMKEYDYIALGGLARKGQRPELYEFLDAAFDIICDADGYPKVKIHGFGITGIITMKMYPWFSVDSTSWLLASRMGKIIVPRRREDGTWDYLDDKFSRSARRIAVSAVSPCASLPNTHYYNISSQWRKEVDDWLEEHDTQMGVSKFRKVPPGYELRDNERWVSKPSSTELEEDEDFFGNKNSNALSKEYIEIIVESGVANNYVERDIINAKYFKELEDKFPKWPWSWKRPRKRGFGLY